MFRKSSRVNIGITTTYRKLYATLKGSQPSFTLVHDFQWGRFRMGFLAAVVVYNWTEAAFKGLSAVWFVFYIIAMDYGHTEVAMDEDLSERAPSEELPEIAHLSETGRLI